MLFLKSIIEGLLILRYWQVWCSALLYVAIMLGFTITAGLIMGVHKPSYKSYMGPFESGRRAFVGYFFFSVVGLVLEGTLMSVMIALLLPILLGGPSSTSISEMISSLWPIFKFGCIATVVITIMCVIPFFGHYIARSTTIQIFLAGIIIFRLMSHPVIEELIIKSNFQGEVYPGIFVSIGFLIIAGAFFLVGMAISALIEYLAGPALSILSACTLGVVAGLIPVFMFCSYVRLSLYKLGV